MCFSFFADGRDQFETHWLISLLSVHFWALPLTTGFSFLHRIPTLWSNLKFSMARNWRRISTSSSDPTRPRFCLTDFQGKGICTWLMLMKYQLRNDAIFSIGLTIPRLTSNRFDFEASRREKIEINSFAAFSDTSRLIWWSMGGYFADQSSVVYTGDTKRCFFRFDCVVRIVLLHLLRIESLVAK